MTPIDELGPHCFHSQARILRERLGLDEKRFMKENERLMKDPEAWPCIPPHARTSRARALAFAMMARGSARANASIDELDNYPFATFDAIGDAERAAAIVSDAKCKCDRVDPWTKRVVQDNNYDLTTPAAQADLLVSAHGARVENVQIELKHSKNRRFVVDRSVQAPVVDADLSLIHI